MVILIGGVGYAGKTHMAQRLLETYHYPYLSIDHLKMGICRADPGCGFTPLDSTEHIGEILWPILKGIIMTNIENRQNIIIEGLYLLPQRISELSDEYLREIISFYLGFSDSYIERYFHSRILRNRCVIETRDEHADPMEDYIRENRFEKEYCAKHGGKYFEIMEDYEREMNAVYAWLDGEVSRIRQSNCSVV